MDASRTRRLFQGPPPRLCQVCGHIMGPYMIICDQCGSIMRPVHGDGTPFPEDEFSMCEICGIPIINEERLCPKCDRLVRVKELKRNRSKNGKMIAAATFCAASLAGVAASIYGLAAAHSPYLFAILLVLFAIILGTSSWILGNMYRRGWRPFKRQAEDTLIAIIKGSR